jgi:hypothetical protein
VRKEGPPSDWCPEELSPSNRLRPLGGRGGAPSSEGRSQRPVHQRVRGWQHLPHCCTLARRGQGWQAWARGGGARRAAANAQGGTRGAGAGHCARTKHTARAQSGAVRLLGLPARGPGNLPVLGTPCLGGPGTRGPSFVRGDEATVAGKRAPPHPHPPLTRHPFFLFHR